jgi:hypothetical protein
MNQRIARRARPPRIAGSASLRRRPAAPIM